MGGKRTSARLGLDGKLGDAMHRVAAFLVASLLASAANADPNCSGPDHWAASITFVKLKSAGVLTNEQVDFKKTQSVQIASQKIGRDLYRQVFRVTYILKDGHPVQAITVTDASREECSMSGGTVYRVMPLGR